MYERHRTTLGALHLVLGLMNILAAVIVWLVLGGVIAIADDPVPTTILATVAAVVGTILGVLAIPSFVAAWGLNRDASWGRAAGLVNSFLNLLSIPFGTCVALYTLWVVFADDGHRL